MTQKQFNQKISHLLNANNLKDIIEKTAANMMNEKYMQEKYLNDAEDNFILPKTVLSAIFTELAYQYEPIGTKKPLLELKRKVILDQPFHTNIKIDASK